MIFYRDKETTMPNMITAERFSKQLLEMFDETFENHQGRYLDKNTTLFETLATITAEEASRPVSATCASIAAQVEHIRFYLEVNENDLMGQEVGSVDWDEIWRTVEAVTPEEWEASKTRLHETYQRLRTLMQNIDTWGDYQIGGSLNILVHTAYHLGEIRQALCTIQSGRT
jgi:hypothetical protein